MSWVAAGTAAVSLGVSAYKGYKGKKQKEKARDEMKKLVKPTYSIPRGIYDNLSDAERRTVEGLSAEQKKEFVQNLERTQSARMKYATDRKSGLLGLQAQTSATNDAYTNLVSRDAFLKTQSKQRKETEIANARSAMAAHKDKAFSVARGDYNAQLASHQADYQAGARNQNAAEMSALNTVISAAGSMAGGIGQGGGGGNKNQGGGVGWGGSSGQGINYNFGQTQQGGFGFN